jgi:hypothetical protein
MLRENRRRSLLLRSMGVPSGIQQLNIPFAAPVKFSHTKDLVKPAAVTRFPRRMPASLSLARADASDATCATLLDLALGSRHRS